MKSTIKLCFFVMAVVSLHSCSSKEDYRTLEGTPTVSITATPIEGMNNRWLITDNTPGAFIHQWELGNQTASFSGMKSDTAYYPEKGTYWLKLRTFTANGFAYDSIQVVVPENDPDRCSGNLAKLTGCDFKVWVLDNTAPGALLIGPPGGVWWSSNAGDIALRTCLFNDEFIFNINGNYTYDNKGDIWIDEEGGGVFPADMGLPIGCASFSDVPAQYSSWGSNNNHSFTLAGNNLTVTGEGAFMGLYKIGNGGVAAGPQTSITYNIISITDEKLVISKGFDGGAWQYTFIPKN